MGYDEAEIEYVNKNLKANQIKIRFASKRSSEEAEEQGAEPRDDVSENDVRQAVADARAACLRFKFLCRTRRDNWLRTLNDLSVNLTSADRDARRRACDEMTQQLAKLDAAYPGELKDEPAAPKSTAKRWIG